MTIVIHSFSGLYKKNIYFIHRQTVSLYPNSSIWLETRYYSRLDKSPGDFTPVGYLNAQLL